MDGLRASRKSWLEELLIGVFTVKHVKLLDEEKGNLFPIVYDKGWFQYAKCTANYYTNYTNLFKRALLDNDTVYYSDTYNMKENIDRDMYGLFPFYHHLLDIDKQLKELFDARSDINDDIYNSIIESNLCNYKRMLYSKYGISDVD